MDIQLKITIGGQGHVTRSPEMILNVQNIHGYCFC